MALKPRQRGKNLDDRTVEGIVEILDEWNSPKLSWDLLIAQIAVRHRVEYSRQALYRHARIQLAFVSRKKSLAAAGRTISRSSPELIRIARLEAENERLRLENNNLLEQFSRWVYNGYLKQMDTRMREFMNTPLPQVFRDRSEK